MTVLRPIRPLLGPEYQVVPSDWLDTMTALQPIGVAVASESSMVSGDGLS
jgi:hypothetical protein